MYNTFISEEDLGNSVSVSSIPKFSAASIKQICEHITKVLPGVSGLNGIQTWTEKLTALSDTIDPRIKLHDVLTSKFLPDWIKIRQVFSNVNILKHFVLFYELHPDLKMSCRISLNNGVYNIISQYITKMSQEFTQPRTAYQYNDFSESNILEGLLARPRALYLLNDFDTMCGKVARDDPNSLCVLSPLVTIARYFHKLKRSTTDFVLKYNALQLRLSVTYPSTSLKESDLVDYYTKSPLHAFELTILHSNLQNIITLVEQKSVDKLKELLEYLPDANSIIGCSTSSTKLSEAKCGMRMLLTSLEPLGTRYNRLNPQIQKKVIRTSVDFPKYLQLQTIQRILDVTEKASFNLIDAAKLLREDLKNHIDQKFNKLGSYYQSVAAFKEQKSNADMGYLQGRLDKYIDQSKTLSEDVDSNVKEILIASISCATLDAAYQGMRLALTIAMMSNPVAAVTGGSSPVDLYDAMSELASALVKVVGAEKLLSSIHKLRDKVNVVAEGFAKNGKVLQMVKQLVESHNSQSDDTTTWRDLKDRFLREYNNYNPQVSTPQLTELGSLFANMVDEACDIIDGAVGWIAAPYKGLIAGKGQCWQTKVEIEKVMQLYSEIHDFQFDLMDAMAENIEDKTMYEAAKGLQTDLSNIKLYESRTNPSLDRMKFTAALSYVTYTIQIWKTIDEYCDILEYKNGGVRPTFCLGASTDIDFLASYVPTICTGDEHSKYVSIPIKPSIGIDYSAVTPNTDTAVLDINRLLAGDQVEFQIPNSNWLVRNKWIGSDQQDSALYVKEFKLYLPVESETKSHVTSKLTAVSENKLAPDANTVYEIIPNKPLNYVYEEGKQYKVCNQDRKVNPFSICPTNKPEDICPITIDKVRDRTSLFPSIYSKFLLQVKSIGYRNMTMLHSTNLNVKVGLMLCLKKTSAQRQASILDKQLLLQQMENAQISQSNTPSCCPSGKYWSETTNTGECVTCPSGSDTALYGYFCQGIYISQYMFHVCIIIKCT